MNILRLALSAVILVSLANFILIFLQAPATARFVVLLLTIACWLFAILSIVKKTLDPVKSVK